MSERQSRASSSSNPALVPGLYRLSRELPPLNPDKRKRHDWRARKLSNGQLFAVSYIDGPHGPVPPVVAYPLGEYSLYGVHEGKAPHLFSALVGPLVEKPSQWLAREHTGMAIARGIIDYLVERKLVTMDQVREAAKHALDSEE